MRFKALGVPGEGQLPGGADNSYVCRGKGIEPLHAEEDSCKQGCLSQRGQAKVDYIVTHACNECKDSMARWICGSSSFGGDLRIARRESQLEPRLRETGRSNPSRRHGSTGRGQESATERKESRSDAGSSNAVEQRRQDLTKGVTTGSCER